MDDRLVLIFAYHYPPENAVGAARPYRFAKYLSRLGYSYRVFTASEQFGRSDPNTEYVPDPFVIRPEGTHPQATHSRRTIGWQFERAIRKALFAGQKGMQWAFEASNAARKFVRVHPQAQITLFSTYPPLGSHLAAWHLARRTGVPWIADFRDAFPDAPELERSRQFQARIYRWLEGMTTRSASAIIANTDAAMGKWKERFPSLDEKFHVIWNGFDPEERIAPLPVTHNDRRVLAHTGELYGGRVATPILESIARLIAGGRLSSRGIRVRMIGTAEPGSLPDQKFLERARADGWLELVTERIPHHEALQIARSSDTLLLMQLRASVHVPAKIFEYLQIGRPILAFIQPNSPSERLLERSGVPFRCVYPGSEAAVIDDTVADFFSLPSAAVAPSAWFEEQFNAKSQTRQLDAIIQRLHKQGETSVKTSARLSAHVKRPDFPQNVTVGKQISKATLDSMDRV